MIFHILKALKKGFLILERVQEWVNCPLPPLEDPSVILTSPQFPKKVQEDVKSTDFGTIGISLCRFLKCSIFLGTKSNESFDDPDSAREVLNTVLKDVKPNQTKEVSEHFQELKAKQKADQSKFHSKLMHEFEYNQQCHNENPHQKKFYNVDQIQDDPVPCHTYDPIHEKSQPIPRKRNVSESQPRRSSIDQARSMFQQLDQRSRSSSLPRKYSSDCYLNKSNFWTGSLPRGSRSKHKVVKFDDEPPARPPPPAPVRTQASLNYKPTKSLFDHDNDEEHRVDLGSYRDKVDPWVELYGKAVLDNTLQDRIEARRLKALHCTPTQQVVMEHDQNDIKYMVKTNLVSMAL